MTVYIGIGGFACKCIDTVEGKSDTKRIFIDSNKDDLDSLNSKADENTLFFNLSENISDDDYIQYLFSKAIKQFKLDESGFIYFRVLSTMCGEFGSKNVFRITKALNENLKKITHDIYILLIPVIFGKQSINTNFFKFVENWQSSDVSDYLEKNSADIIAYVAEAPYGKYLDITNAEGFSNEVIKALDCLIIPLLRTPIIKTLRYFFVEYTGDYIFYQREYKKWLKSRFKDYLTDTETEDKADNAADTNDSSDNPYSPEKADGSSHPEREPVPADDELDDELDDDINNEENQDKPFVNENENYVFISYSHKNYEAAESFRELLNRNGIKTWMAPNDIPFGSTYTGVITRALRNCCCLVLILSEDSQKSVFVKRETERAIKYEKTIIPINIDESDLNDEFEFMIGACQIAVIRKIDEKSPQIIKVLENVRSIIKKNN